MATLQVHETITLEKIILSLFFRDEVKLDFRVVTSNNSIKYFGVEGGSPSGIFSIELKGDNVTLGDDGVLRGAIDQISIAGTVWSRTYFEIFDLSLDAGLLQHYIHSGFMGDLVSKLALIDTISAQIDTVQSRELGETLRADLVPGAYRWNLGSGDDNFGLLQAPKEYFRITGGAGNDYVFLADSVIGTHGVRVDLNEGTYRDVNGTIHKLIGVESAGGSSRKDIFYGNDKNNRFSGGDRDDIFYGGAGDDNFYGGNGQDVYYGGEGSDRLSFGTSDWRTDEGVRVDLRDGTTKGFWAKNEKFESIEELSGTDERDVFRGDANVNSLWGQKGDDLLVGRGNDDWIHGGWGDDKLFGGSGNDTLDGDYHNNILYGGLGDDLLLSGYVTDYIFGGKGIDTFVAKTSSLTIDLRITGLQKTGYGEDKVIGVENVIGSGQPDNITGSWKENTLWGKERDDVLKGMKQNDTLFGGQGNDTLFGGAENDILRSGSGDNTLFGGSGDDYLFLGAGDNVANGGKGADSFVFANAGANSRIEDFGRGDDVLRISKNFGNASFDEIQGTWLQDGADLVISLDFNTVVLLLGVELSNLSAQSFEFF